MSLKKWFKYSHRITILFTALFFAGLYSQGQDIPPRMEGKIFDQLTGEPLSNATIKIRSTADTLITITNSKGQFYFKNLRGDIYTTSVSAISYLSLDTVINFKTSPSLSFSLVRDIKQMESVTVTARQIKNSINKISYTVSEADRGKHPTGIDLLSTVPLINTNESGVVFVKGHSNIQILIDGKPILDNSILKSLSPKVISKIEIQTNPQAEYSGSGLYSVVNIITLKNWRGYYGDISATIGTKGTYNPSLYLSYKNKKIETNLLLGTNTYERPWDNSILSTFASGDKINLRQNMTNRGFSPYATLGLKFSATKKASINYAFSYTLSSFHNTGYLTYISTPYSQPEIRLQSVRQNKKIIIPSFKNYIDYTNKIDAKSTLSIAMQYYFQHSKQTTENDIDNVTYYSRNKILNEPGLNEFSAQVNYRKTINQEKNYSLGAKWINRFNKSAYSLDTFDYGMSKFLRVQDIVYSNNFSGTQNIFSLYGNTSFPITKKISGEAGLRIEHTSDNINFSYVATVKRNYWQVIPNATIYYSLDDDTYFSLDVNKSVYRPAISYLNPITNISNPRNIEVGNPDLLPEKGYSADLSFSKTVKANNFYFSAYYQGNKDIITSGLIASSGDTLITKNINAATASTFGFSADITYQLLKSLKATVHLAFENNRVSALQNTNSGNQFLSNANIFWRLPKKYSVRFTHQYNSPFITFQGKGFAISSNEITVNKRLLKDNLVLSVGASNFFTFNYERNASADFGAVMQKTSSNLHLNYVYFKVFYSFGKSQYASNPSIKVSNGDLKNPK